jgi:hypothetical protein
MELNFANLTVIFLVIQTIAFFYRRLFRLRSATLNCGLFGGCFVGAPNMDKIRILGLYNQSRGLHSCGYYYNGEIKKGVDKLKEWRDFIQDNVLIPNEDGHVFIGHARHSTGGLHNAENQHPFHVENLVLAHNGKIDNWMTLCNKYDVDHKNIFVDSKGLAALIAKEGYKVLSEYQGYAALLMLDTKKPNTLYIYHGSSKETVNGKELIERPLYMMQTDEGVYVSSLSEALWAIRNNEEEYPVEVETNRVIPIVDGKFGKTKAIINRSEANVFSAKTYNYGYNNTNYHSDLNTSYDSVTREWVTADELIRRQNVRVKEFIGTSKPSTQNNCCSPTYKKPQQSQILCNVKVIPNLISKETFPSRVKTKEGNIVYYYAGRHWTRIDNTIKFADGTFFIDRKGFIEPNKHLNNKVYHFYRGVMIRSEKCYDTLMDIINNDRKGKDDFTTYIYNFAMAISKYSSYPVTNTEFEATNVAEEFKYNWYFDGESANSNINAKFSDRVYRVVAGQLLSISSSLKNADTPTISLNTHPSGVAIQLPFFNDDDKKNENDEKEEDSFAVTGNIGDQVHIENEKDLPKEVITLSRKYCYRKYSSLDEIETEVPSTIIRAIELYIVDTLSEEGGGEEITVNPTDFKGFVNDFLFTLVNDGLTISGNMTADCSPIEEYILDAYQEEIEEQEEEIQKREEEITKLEEQVLNISNNIQTGAKVINLHKDDEINYQIVEEDEDVVDTINVIDKAVENKQAQRIIEEAVSSIATTRALADELSLLVKSDFAQEAAQKLYQNSDNLISGLCEKLEGQGASTLMKKLKQINSNL